MSGSLKLRNIKSEDVGKVCLFWRENYKTERSDTPRRIKPFLEMNSGLSIMLVEDGEIIGTALGAYDGRKGYIQKVAVKRDHCRRGLGSRLVRKTVSRLKKAGAPVPVNDLWLAAQSFQTGSRLVTHDRHFLKVPGLLLWDRLREN